MAETNDKKVVVCLGTAVVDFLAYVSSYPKKDEKIRTNDLQVATGGNVLNGICALSEFGANTRLVTSLGKDSNANLITDLCVRLNVDTRFLQFEDDPRFHTPFSYIIVDQESQTRTIIHTPGKDLGATEIKKEMMNDAKLLYLDSRHPQAAVQAIKWAKEMKVPIVLDIEREKGKEGEEDFMITNATAILSSGNYVMKYSKKEDVLEAMAKVLQGGVAELYESDQCCIITTWGESGSILLREVTRDSLSDATHQSVASVTDLKFRRAERPTLTKDDWLNHKDLSVRRFRYSMTSPSGAKLYEVVYCVGYPLEKTEFVDGTAAGDVYIGTTCFAYMNRNRYSDVGDMMRLASFCAAAKCMKPGGASKGMPKLNDIPAVLLK